MMAGRLCRRGPLSGSRGLRHQLFIDFNSTLGCKFDRKIFRVLEPSKRINMILVGDPLE